MSIRAYNLLPNASLTISPARFDCQRYVQAGIHITDIPASGMLLDLPIGPPLQPSLQIYQVHMTCESPSCEWSLHTRPYAKCKRVDWVFQGVTNLVDELIQEAWLVPHCSRAVEPYLFFSFKELSGVAPGSIRFEMRIIC